MRASYDDYERCLQEVDAVYICTPNSEHADYAVRAAKAGKHILCEKPLAVTQQECERMIKAAKDNNVKIMTAYRLHFEPLFLEVLEIVKSGKIGEPRFFNSSFSMHARPGGIRTQRELGGGTLFDLGVYCINTARLMFRAEPIEVFGSSIDGARSNMPEIDEMTSAVMRFDGDRLATFTTSFNANGVSDFRVVGTEGNIHAEPAYEYAEALGYTLTVGETVKKKKGRRRDQFAAEIAYFSDCVMHGQGSGAVGGRGLLGRARRQRALPVSAERQAREAESLRTANRRPTQAAGARIFRRCGNRNSSRSRNRTTKAKEGTDNADG